ncbi:MAG: EndoU domain-containing protein [Alphaproteobacteria bacterium]
MRARRPAGRFFFRKLFLAAIVVALFAPMGLKELAVFHPLDPTGRTLAFREATNPRLTSGSIEHILRGDERGGGHMHGTNRPCKSEFPADWTEQDIMDSVKLIAANDNLAWVQGRNGNYVADSMSHGVKIRVVLSADRRVIITAYPLNMPRNPCPAPANDNDP